MEIVSEFQRLLSDRVGTERYALWFGPGVGLSLDESTLVIRSADSFLLERLRNRFLDDVQSVCDSLFGRTIKVVFEHDYQLAQEPHSPKPESDDSKRQTTLLNGSSARRHARRRYAQLSEFVESPENRIAFAAALSASQRPGTVSPLFFYGPPGAGKTHLLEGMTSEVRKNRLVKQTVCLSAEKFTSDFLEALRGGGLPSFRRKHRDVDVLMIDDIQFFSGKKATIIELQHTMDSLLRDGRQIVLAADRPPAQLPGITSELSARMSGGLICPLELPTYSTRIKLLEQITQRKGVALANEVIELIADKVNGDVRLLIGAVNRLVATSNATGESIGIAMTERTLSDLFRCACRAIQMSDIDRVVCDVFGLENRSLRGKAKTKAVSQPRALAMWLARKYTRAAYSEIGSYFGSRSHSTVISAQKKVEQWVENGSSIRMTHGDCRINEALRRIESDLRTG